MLLVCPLLYRIFKDCLVRKTLDGTINYAIEIIKNSHLISKADVKFLHTDDMDDITLGNAGKCTEKN